MHFQGVDPCCAPRCRPSHSQLCPRKPVAMAEAVRHRPFITARKTLNKGCAQGPAAALR